MNDQIDLKTISSIPMFSAAPMDAFKQVRSAASVHPLDEGKTLFDEGKASREVYFILEGTVRIYCYSNEERDVLLWTSKPVGWS